MSIRSSRKTLKSPGHVTNFCPIVIVRLFLYKSSRASNGKGAHNIPVKFCLIVTQHAHNIPVTFCLIVSAGARLPSPEEAAAAAATVGRAGEVAAATAAVAGVGDTVVVTEAAEVDTVTGAVAEADTVTGAVAEADTATGVAEAEAVEGTTTEEGAAAVATRTGVEAADTTTGERTFAFRWQSRAGRLCPRLLACCSCVAGRRDRPWKRRFRNEKLCFVTPDFCYTRCVAVRVALTEVVTVLNQLGAARIEHVGPAVDVYQSRLVCTETRARLLLFCRRGGGGGGGDRYRPY
eukprot:1180741-Prorocentrum_minimum.AAC.6